MNSQLTSESIKISHEFLDQKGNNYCRLKEKDVLYTSNTKKENEEDEKNNEVDHYHNNKISSNDSSKLEYSKSKTTDNIEQYHKVLYKNTNDVQDGDNRETIPGLNLTSINNIEARLISNNNKINYFSQNLKNNEDQSTQSIPILNNKHKATTYKTQNYSSDSFKEATYNAHCTSEMIEKYMIRRIYHVYSLKITNIEKIFLKIGYLENNDVNMSEDAERIKNNSCISIYNKPVSLAQLYSSTNNFIYVASNNMSETTTLKYPEFVRKSSNYTKTLKESTTSLKYSLKSFKILFQQQNSSKLKEDHLSDSISDLSDIIIEEKYDSLEEPSILLKENVSVTSNAEKIDDSKSEKPFLCKNVVNFDETESHIDFTSKNFEIANICSIDDFVTHVDHNNIKTLYEHIKENIDLDNFEEDDGFSFYKLGIARRIVFCNVIRHESGGKANRFY